MCVAHTVTTQEGRDESAQAMYNNGSSNVLVAHNYGNCSAVCVPMMKSTSWCFWQTGGMRAAMRSAPFRYTSRLTTTIVTAGGVGSGVTTDASTALESIVTGRGCRKDEKLSIPQHTIHM